MGLWDWLHWPGRRKPPHIPSPLWSKCIARYDFLRALTADEDSRLKTLSEAFLAEKEFAGAAGLEVSDEMCVTIAAQACLPILHLGIEAYRGWVEIIVYPGGFKVHREVEDQDGVVHTHDDYLSGEAWAGGPVILSWRDARGAHGGDTVVIHEFAHKLDMLNGDADGVPALPNNIPHAIWEHTLADAYEDFCERIDGAERGEHRVKPPPQIDPYAAQDTGEFFAVTSEVFFGAPHILVEAYPALYQLFVAYYRQDPLTRFRADNPA